MEDIETDESHLVVSTESSDSLVEFLGSISWRCEEYASSDYREAIQPRDRFVSNQYNEIFRLKRKTSGVTQFLDQMVGRSVTFSNVNDSTAIASGNIRASSVTEDVLTITLSHEDNVLGTAYLASDGTSVIIGGIPRADIFIPRRGFEHVGQQEARLTLLDRDELQLTRLRPFNEFRLNGAAIEDCVILKPGRYALSIGPSLFTLRVQRGQVVIPVTAKN